MMQSTALNIEYASLAGAASAKFATRFCILVCGALTVLCDASSSPSGCLCRRCWCKWWQSCLRLKQFSFSSCRSELPMLNESPVRPLAFVLLC